MRVILMAAAAAAVLFTVAPASAQFGRDGVSVRIETDGHRDGWRHRRFHRDVYRSFGRGDCREITVRKRMPDGSMVIRKTRRCD
jgi:hypothetical protein